MQNDPEDDKFDPTSKILVFGGCHVMNYPLGFIDLLRGKYPETTAIPHTKASHANKILAKIQTESPALVVFQVGNFENPYPFVDQIKKALRRRIGMKKIDNGSAMPFLQILPTSFKILLDRFLARLGLGIANPASFNKHFSQLISDAALLLPGRLLVMSPLPSPDLWISHGRSLANDFMRGTCENMHVRYIDIIGQKDSWSREMFTGTDTMHFNIHGHRMLYEITVQEIRKLLNDGPDHAS